MQYHFGFNCSHFIPYFKKCRVHVNEYRKREELVEEKALETKQIMIYLDLSEEDLLEKFKTAEIKLKKEKTSDGSLILTVPVAFQYDDCPLARNAGICNYFEGHNGKKISYLIEMAGIAKEHPNIKLEPSKDCVLRVEQDIKNLINK